FGIPESEIAETLRVAEREGVELGRIEVTTCLKRGEVEIVARYEPDAAEVYAAFAAVVESRHADTLFSEDGSTVDQQVAALLRERSWTIATAGWCTGGRLAARLTELPGSSDYVRGAIVAYANEVKVALADVSLELIETHGAVSSQVAEALAPGARARASADVGVGITGVAGGGGGRRGGGGGRAGREGGSEEKPVGLVWISVALEEQEPITRSVNLPGGRADVRDRSTTVAMHLVRRALADA